MNGTTNKARSFILMTVLLGVVIVLASYFLLIAPVLSGASEANANADDQIAANDNTQIEVNKLKEQFAHIDEYNTQLAALQVQIPIAPMYPELQSMFAEIAAKHHVTIISLQFGAATQFDAPAPPADTEGDGTAAAPSPSPSPSPSPGTGGTDDASTGPGAAAGQYGIPVSVSVAGKYDDVMSTLQELQTGTGRIMLVSNVNLTRGTDGVPLAIAGLPAGIDTLGVFAGSTFVITSSTPTEQAPADDGSGTSPTPAPSASS